MWLDNKKSRPPFTKTLLLRSNSAMENTSKFTLDDETVAADEASIEFTIAEKSKNQGI